MITHRVGLTSFAIFFTVVSACMCAPAASANDSKSPQVNAAAEQAAVYLFSRRNFADIREAGSRFLLEHDGDPSIANITTAICLREKNSYPSLSWDLIEAPTVWLVLGRVCLRYIIVPEQRRRLTAELRAMSLEALRNSSNTNQAEAALTLGAIAQPEDVSRLQNLASSNDDEVATAAVLGLHLIGQRLNFDYLGQAIPKIGNARARAAANDLRKQITNTQKAIGSDTR